MSIDRYDWHYDSAVRLYCGEQQTLPEALSDGDIRAIENRAAAHIGIFAAWLIKQGYLITSPDRTPAAEAVRSGRTTGTEYLMTELDGKLLEKDIVPGVLTFVCACYSEYLGVFPDYIAQRLGLLPYAFEETPEIARTAEPLIDELFRRCCRKG